MSSTTERRVFREGEDGNLQRLPIVETEHYPTAAEVVEGLRAFCGLSESEQDLVLLRVQQARVLVERIDEMATVLRKAADQLAGLALSEPLSAPESDERPRTGTRGRSRRS